MSEENVEAVRAVYDRWREGDFWSSADVLDPLVLFVLPPGFLAAGTYLGLERLAEYTRGFLEPWTRVTIELRKSPTRGTAWLWPHFSADWGAEAAHPPSSVTSRSGPSGVAR